jgi:hypothetical protein
MWIVGSAFHLHFHRILLPVLQIGGVIDRGAMARQTETAIHNSTRL